MKPLTLIWLAVSTALSAFVLLPAPNRLLLPLGVASPELSPWLALSSLLGFAIALRFYRRAAAFFLPALLIPALPLIQAVGTFSLLDCFRGVPAPRIEPQDLPRNILLYRPPAATPLPILIDIYGGAWQRGAPADNRPFDSYMASRGYAVFAIDYRHAPAARFPAQLDDVRAAISFLRENAARYGADPARLALCGRSSGGQLALLAAYDGLSAPIAAVVAFYAPTDLTAGYADPPSPDPLHIRSVLETYLGGPPAALPERYRAASPATFANRPVPPTLLLQGARDHIVKPVSPANCTTS